MDVAAEADEIIAATSFESVPDLGDRHYSKSEMIEINEVRDGKKL